MPSHLVDAYISVDVYLPTGLLDITSLKDTCVESHLFIDMKTSIITYRLSQKTKNL
jgi:hypothetical protein